MEIDPVLVMCGMVDRELHKLSCKYRLKAKTISDIKHVLRILSSRDYEYLKDKYMTINLNIEELKEINKKTFEAFIESGRYAFTKAEAYKQFGRKQIDTLITNGLLENESELPGKHKYLLSDIITAFHIWDTKFLLK